MVSRTMTRTPPPPSADEMVAPDAPRFGYQDDYHPYPKTRSTTRNSAQRNRTPSPCTSPRKPLASPQTARRADKQSRAAMVSPIPSPRKRRQPPMDTSRRSISGTLTAESITNAAVALGQFDLPPANNFISAPRASSSRSGGMLPTPSKTPSKPPNKKMAAEISGFACNLFANEESATRRKTRSGTGPGMDSFTTKKSDEPIKIFTDSKDSIPEIDTSEANPFYTVASKQKGSESPRRSQRNILIPGEGLLPLDQAAGRDDGMVYVFRGKKYWRKFADIEEAEIGEETDLERPLTRFSVKPKLLFPPKKQEVNVEDEEAVTDIEDGIELRKARAVPQTPSRSRKEKAKTPEAPRYAPVSPPETRRTTRSANKLSGDDAPAKNPKRQPSLFDSWPRTKEHKAPAAAKRAGESLAQTPTKRTRA